jgi:hypothetical protein
MLAGSSGRHSLGERGLKQGMANDSARERETTVMTVWPSVAAMSLGGIPLGLMLGRLYSIRAGFYIFTLGNLICLLMIPVALILYFKRIGPFVGRRYRLTTQRIVVLRGLTGKEEEKAIGLDQFDQIDIVVRSGQEWYHAGDLIFRQGNVERFMLEGVSRPEAFRQVCLKTHQGFMGVREALKRQAVYA